MLGKKALTPLSFESWKLRTAFMYPLPPSRMSVSVAAHRATMESGRSAVLEPRAYVYLLFDIKYITLPLKVLSSGKWK